MRFSVSASKITDYLLRNPEKSRFFLLFGYAVEDWERLQRDILALAARHEVEMRLRKQTVYGREYEIVGYMVTPSRRTVRLKTSWYLDAGETDIIRFITAYPD
jgi:hypothetical protein